jgi:hypothetical protein
MSNFLDEAGIVNLLPRPNIVTQAPTRAPTQAPLSPQLQTAATLTRVPAPTTKTNIVPVATPGPIASTPMPLPQYAGPQDDLLFDPDELTGDAGPGAGYALPGTATIAGPTSSMMPQMNPDASGQVSMGSNVSTAATAGTTQSMLQGIAEATAIDLADEDTPGGQESGGFMKSYGKWIVIIALIIATILLLLAFYGLPAGVSGGGGRGGGMPADPYGISSGGIASGIGGAGVGGLGGLGGLGAGGYGGY